MSAGAHAGGARRGILGSGPHLPPSARAGVHLQPARCDLSARGAAAGTPSDHPSEPDHSSEQERLRRRHSYCASPFRLSRSALIAPRVPTERITNSGLSLRMQPCPVGASSSICQWVRNALTLVSLGRDASGCSDAARNRRANELCRCLFRNTWRLLFSRAVSVVGQGELTVGGL